MNMVVDNAGLRWVGLDTKMYRTPYNKNQIYNFICQKEYLRVDNININSESDSNGINWGNFYIFRNYTSTQANIRLYSFKLYDNLTLVRDFIPAKRNSDNVIGLYDKLNNKFYINSGTGTFLPGKEISNKDIIMNEFIEE